MIETPSKHPWAGLFLFVAVCFAVAGTGGAVTAPKIGTWYATLAKPSWTPPDWIFAPVWSLLYLSMAVAAWLVWRQSGWAGAVAPLTLFGVQLLLNASWSWVFFGLERPGLALADVLLLLAAIAATTVAFWRRSKLAGMLFLPCLTWVGFASALNFAVWRLNA
jgi:tryptophan-rich sensory protein